MTFSMSLPTVLRRTTGLKALGESYDFLLGLGMMTGRLFEMQRPITYFNTSISNTDDDV